MQHWSLCLCLGRVPAGVVVASVGALDNADGPHCSPRQRWRGDGHRSNEGRQVRPASRRCHDCQLRVSIDRHNGDQLQDVFPLEVAQQRTWCCLEVEHLCCWEVELCCSVPMRSRHPMSCLMCRLLQCRLTICLATAWLRLMASGGMDAQVCIWDLQSATPLSVVYLPDEAVRALSISSDQQLLAYCCQAAGSPQQQQGSSLDVVSVNSGGHHHSVGDFATATAALQMMVAALTRAAQQTLQLHDTGACQGDTLKH